MKNKKLLYLLLPLMVVVWGAVFYRVFKGIGGDDDYFDALPAAVKMPVLAKQDSFDLIADYKDPFLGKGPGRSRNTNPAIGEKPLTPTVRQLPKPPPPTLPWPAIGYGGFVNKSGGKNKLAVVTIDGQTSWGKLGEEIQGVTIQEIWKDSVQVSYRKEVKTVLLNGG
ncbi:MAG: hypothetical protein ACFB10_22870 [Salibacteraceae bacterium]